MRFGLVLFTGLLFLVPAGPSADALNTSGGKQIIHVELSMQNNSKIQFNVAEGDLFAYSDSTTDLSRSLKATVLDSHTIRFMVFDGRQVGASARIQEMESLDLARGMIASSRTIPPFRLRLTDLKDNSSAQFLKTSKALGCCLPCGNGVEVCGCSAFCPQTNTGCCVGLCCGPGLDIPTLNRTGLVTLGFALLLGALLTLRRLTT